MADDTKEDEDKKESGEESEQTSTSAQDNNSKMKLIVIMALCMVLLSVTAMVSTVFLTINRDSSSQTSAETKKSKSADAEDTEEVAEEDSDEDEDEDGFVDNGTPRFYQFNPTFVVNIPAKGRVKFLQVQVQVMSFDKKVIEDIDQYAPLIKNDLVQLFGQQTYDELTKPEGKEVLRAKALVVIKSILTKHTGEDGIEQVLFTSFITQ